MSSVLIFFLLLRKKYKQCSVHSEHYKKEVKQVGLIRLIWYLKYNDIYFKYFCTFVHVSSFVPAFGAW
jgi:hypothetical protein